MPPNPSHATPTDSRGGVVIDVENPRRDAIADHLPGDSHTTVIDRDAADTLLAEHPKLSRLRPAAAELRPGEAPIDDTHEQGHAGGC